MTLNTCQQYWREEMSFITKFRGEYIQRLLVWVISNSLTISSHVQSTRNYGYTEESRDSHLYCGETWSPNLREEREVQVFENRIPRGNYSKWECGILQNEYFRYLWNLSEGIKSRKLRCGGESDKCRQEFGPSISRRATSYRNVLPRARFRAELI
jgi:hypothetical protein